VAYTCNPSYSGGRDQEDRGSKSSRANNSQDSTLKKTYHKKGLVEWAQGVGPEFKPKYCKKKKKKNTG
jgi:hypothetical protein